MSVFLVSFEIKYDSDYQRRYSSFTQQVQSGRYWADNTSFVVVETTETIDDFCTRIYVHSAFDGTKDRYMVLDANVKSGRIRGPVHNSSIFSLLPFVIKL